MKREIEARLGRLKGMSAETAEWLEQETAKLEWYGIDRRTGLVVKGTAPELRALADG